MQALYDKEYTLSISKQAEEIKGDTFNPFPEPFRSKLGQSECKSLGDEFGLTQFGVNLELLQPNARSSLRHWHTASDEFLYVVDGEVTLVTNSGEQIIGAGMCIGFPAGIDDGHCLINHTEKIAKFIAIGSRNESDKAVYNDDDFQWVVAESGEWVASNKDGKPY